MINPSTPCETHFGEAQTQRWEDEGGARCDSPGAPQEAPTRPAEEDRQRATVPRPAQA